MIGRNICGSFSKMVILELIFNLQVYYRVLKTEYEAVLKI